MLSANSIQEISLKVNPLIAGRRMMFLNIVGKHYQSHFNFNPFTFKC